jgi:hypothetical protein
MMATTTTQIFHRASLTVTHHMSQQMPIWLNQPLTPMEMAITTRTDIQINTLTRTTPTRNSNLNKLDNMDTTSILKGCTRTTHHNIHRTHRCKIMGIRITIRLLQSTLRPIHLFKSRTKFWMQQQD